MSKVFQKWGALMYTCLLVGSFALGQAYVQGGGSAPFSVGALNATPGVTVNPAVGANTAGNGITWTNSTKATAWIMNVSTIGAAPNLEINAGGSPHMQFNASTGLVSMPFGAKVGALQVSTLAISSTAPTLTGFGGTGAAVSGSNGTVAFDINVGTGAPGSTGTITLPAATTGWNCYCHDITTTPLVRQTVQTGGSTTTCVIAEVTTSTGAALNWTASDHLRCTALAF